LDVLFPRKQTPLPNKIFPFFQVANMKEEEVMELVNIRPEVIVLMSQKQLEGVLVHKPGKSC
jgi:hypothetical protein